MRLGRYERRLICCALLLIQLGFSGRQISIVNAFDCKVYPCQPFAVSLARMLAEAELATAGAAEGRCLRQRAELMRELLTPRPSNCIA